MDTQDSARLSTLGAEAWDELDIDTLYAWEHTINDWTSHDANLPSAASSPGPSHDTGFLYSLQEHPSNLNYLDFPMLQPSLLQEPQQQSDNSMHHQIYHQLQGQHNIEPSLQPPPSHQFPASTSSNQAPQADSGAGLPQCFEHGCNGRTFSCRENYLRHMRERSSMIRIQCGFCGKTFTRRSNLTIHLKEKCKAWNAQSRQRQATKSSDTAGPADPESDHRVQLSRSV